jgi:hypothetical protein
LTNGIAISVIEAIIRTTTNIAEIFILFICILFLFSLKLANP